MNIAWNNSIWFFDLDDTLVDTAGAGIIASEGVYDFLATQLENKIAVEIKNRFIDLFNLLLCGYRVTSEEGWNEITGGKAAHDALLARIKAAQPSVIDQYGEAKKWSREVLIMLAAEDHNVALSPEQVHLSAKAYWDHLAENVELLEGTTALIEAINRHNRPVYIITSSDGRLQMQDDGTFIYDPNYSEQLKSERLEKLKEKGIAYTAYRIGDPEDKPHLEFFEKIINAAKDDFGDIDYNNCVMLGDSYSGDLETPRKKIGFGLVVHIDHDHGQVEEVDEGFVVAGNLQQFLDWFESKQK